MNRITFITSFLTFYLKGFIETDNNFVKLECPNTILSLIPLGKVKKQVSVTQLAEVGTSFYLRFKDFVVGVLVAIIGLALMTANPVCIIVAAIGVLMALNSIQTKLTISTTAGAEYTIYFLVFEKSKAEKAAEIINSIIVLRQEDTNVRIQGDRQTDRVIEAIKAK